MNFIYIENHLAIKYATGESNIQAGRISNELFHY